jgi:tetratricopeptide (TPR) repeat protein
MGMIELKMNNLSKAIEDFKEAISLLSFQYSITSFHALFIDALALAYFQSGDLERAHAGYERITILTTGKFDFGDIYAKAFYMLGKIHEQQGDTAKAIENYEKFLELWKDADPGIVEVEDAKKRLAGLLSQ